MCHNHYTIVNKSAAKVIFPKNAIFIWLMNVPIAAIIFFHSLKCYHISNTFVMDEIKHEYGIHI